MSGRGSLFVVSAPSGTGKTTAVDALVARVPGLRRSRSYTSRPPPPQRSATASTTTSWIASASGRCATGASSSNGPRSSANLYGTRALDTRRELDAGRSLVLVIDVQGAGQVRGLEPDAVGIFLLPPSPAVLQDRLRRRQGDRLTEPEMRRRLDVARREVRHVAEYDYVVVNDDLEACIERLRCIVEAERQSWRAAGGRRAGDRGEVRRPRERSGLMGPIALGVTGGIGAYKAVEIVRRLQQGGHDVVVIMTANARRFVGPLTFEAITRRPVVTDQFAPGANATIEHVSLATDIRALLVAPATANTIGKLAHGIADDFLTSLYLVTRAPVVIAPAMNSNMYEHAAVAANLAALEARGAHVVAPGEGYLACGWTGPGRLASVEDVVAAVERRLRPAGGDGLAGRRILVSAGPTCEDLDPVRFVGKPLERPDGVRAPPPRPSTAAPGWCWCPARASLDPPAGAEVVRVRSAADMHAAVMGRAVDADAVIMAAAVADYTPGEGPRAQKIAKESETLTLTLTRTPTSCATSAGGAATGAGPCSSGSRPRPATSSRGRGPSSRRRGRT